VPLFCQTCIASGAPRARLVMNMLCIYDKCCCDPEDPDCLQQPL